MVREDIQPDAVALSRSRRAFASNAYYLFYSDHPQLRLRNRCLDPYAGPGDGQSRL